MTVYSISYDLHKQGELSYENLINAIKAYPDWCHHLESDWMVVSTGKAETVRDDLIQHIHKDDKLIVMELAGTAAWYNLPDSVSKWIQKHL